MVFEDLSAPQSHSNSRLAPVTDRVLSVAVDLALFSPIFSLLLSGLLRRLQERYEMAPESGEFWALVALIFVGYFGLTVFAQGLFWSVFGATPGQMFFQLRVVRLDEKRFPTLFQAWLRSFLFLIECGLMGFPLLEVFSHPDRRVFHDRACETEVVTLKAVGAARPQQMEARFIHLIFTACLAFVLIGIFSFLSQVDRQVRMGFFKEAQLTEHDLLCPEVIHRENASRMDTALALFEAGNLNRDCLGKEIDFSFWRGTPSDQAWASFATALMNEDDKALVHDYLDQTCAKDPKGSACALAVWWRSDRTQDLPTTASWTRSVLALQHWEHLGLSGNWRKELNDLPADFEMSEFIETQRLKLMWSENRPDLARGGYQVIWDQLSSAAKNQLAATFCFSELTEDCSVKPYSFCRDLENSLRADGGDEIKPEWVVALAEEKSCRKATEPNLVDLAQELDPDSESGHLILAVLPESEMTSDERLVELRRIAFTSQATPLIKARALVHLLRESHEPADLAKGQKLLAGSELPGRKSIQTLMAHLSEPVKKTEQPREPASLKEAR